MLLQTKIQKIVFSILAILLLVTTVKDWFDFHACGAVSVCLSDAGQLIHPGPARMMDNGTRGKEQGILGRRYFYPLISEFSTYRGLESSRPENLPVAHKMANSVICLPMHHALSETDIERILHCITEK